MNYSIVWPDGWGFNESLGDSKQINSGKTKLIYPHQNGLAIVHKDIITAMDNPDYTWDAPWKWTASAFSTALLFKRIEAKWIPTSHLWIVNSNTTFDKNIEMLPFEIIWRRYNVSWNSWEARNPWQFEVGARYPEIKFEACLKWSVMTEEWIIHDPFMIMDDEFKPLLWPDWMPRLMHPKKPNTELIYTKVVNPNKWFEISKEEVMIAIEQFSRYAWEIYNIANITQETTFDTYAEIGRLNADGKIEVGIDKSTWLLTLGDELELDSLRNMSLQKIEVNGQIFEFESDLLGQSLDSVIADGANKVDRIINARHSGKQVYRNLVKPWWDFQWKERISANNAAAKFVTRTIYLPTALALSDRFSEEVWYILENKPTLRY